MPEIKKIVQDIDKQLKRFQSASVDYVMDQFYEKHRNKVLIADEVGLGKTIIAKTLAQELSDNGEKILFLCFNRTLGNKISYETGIKNNSNIVSGTFHSFAKRKIESVDVSWWENIDKSKGRILNEFSLF